MRDTPRVSAVTVATLGRSLPTALVKFKKLAGELESELIAAEARAAEAEAKLSAINAENKAAEEMKGWHGMPSGKTMREAFVRLLGEPLPHEMRWFMRKMARAHQQARIAIKDRDEALKNLQILVRAANKITYPLRFGKDVPHLAFKELYETQLQVAEAQSRLQSRERLYD